MKLNKKFMSTMALVLASSMALTACGSNDSSTPSTSAPSTSTPSSDASSNAEASTPVEDNVRRTSDGYKISDTQEFIFNLGADPLTIDPQLNSATDGSHVITNMFEGLIRESGGEVTPGMAKSWDISDDGLTYTFHLRDGIKWSDGQPVVAGDFEYAWKRAVDPATASKYAYIFGSANILNANDIVDGKTDFNELGVVALDDKTLQVTLEMPTEYFLRLTGFPTFMPVREDIVDPDGIWAKKPETAISNGPFMLQSYSMSDNMVLVKNPNYWNADNIELEKITMRMITEASTAYTAFNSNEVYLIDEIPTAEIGNLMATSHEFYIEPYIGTYFLIFDLEDNEVLQDVNVRKALNYAIDRTEITEHVTKGGEIPATSFVGPGFTDANGKDFYSVGNMEHDNYGIPKQADIAAAQAALAEAGYPNGEGFPTLEYMYNTNDGHKAVAEAIQQMWKENLGIDVTLTNQEWAVFQETRNNKTFTGLARHGWIGDYADPNTMLEMFISNSAQNNMGYSSEEFDEQLYLSRVTTGTERMDHLYKAQEILMNDLPLIPIYYYTNPLLVKDEVHQWEITSTGKYYFGNTVMIDLD
ncbi:MAG: ABC transporter substrate-binding protein [Epulopiscium sp. Nele67-Bin005]|nr:MAG: ABC transporter substrate-binding protein [Epulopiscium sp. Nele67-Bin005]